jgi:hypothetical protein
MSAKNVRVTSFSSVDINVKERIFSADLEILAISWQIYNVLVSVV